MGYAGDSRHSVGLLSVPPRRGGRRKKTQYLHCALKQKENDTHRESHQIKPLEQYLLTI